MKKLLIVLTRVKKIAGIRISNTLPEALNKEVEQLIKKAAFRAKANSRKTIQPRDL